jgi:hypothetical protein
MKTFGITIAAMMMPVVAYAQDATPPEGVDLIGAIIEAAQGGEWSLFVSLLIMFLVYVATRAPGIKDWVKGEAKIWTAAVAGVLASFATALFVDVAGGDGVDWLNVIMQGLGVGLTAGGLWSLIGRKIMGKPVDANNDGVLDDLSIVVEEDEEE